MHRCISALMRQSAAGARGLSWWSSPGFAPFTAAASSQTGGPQEVTAWARSGGDHRPQRKGTKCATGTQAIGLSKVQLTWRNADVPPAGPMAWGVRGTRFPSPRFTCTGFIHAFGQADHRGLPAHLITVLPPFLHPGLGARGVGCHGAEAQAPPRPLPRIAQPWGPCGARTPAR